MDWQGNTFPGEKIVYNGFIQVAEVPGVDHPHVLVRAADSVCVLIYDAPNKRIVLVRQPRESMVCVDNPDGLITETCAGRCDDGLPPRALMVKEVFQETGLTIQEADIQLLNSGEKMAVTAGICTERSLLGYVELKPGQEIDLKKIHSAPDENEQIRLLVIPIDGLDTYICEDIRVFGVIQWLKNRQKDTQIEKLIESCDCLSKTYLRKEF